MKEFAFLALLILGFGLIANGLFHAIFYLLDDKALFAGMRYINWLCLFLGIPYTIFLFKLLDKSKRPIS